MKAKKRILSIIATLALSVSLIAMLLIGASAAAADPTLSRSLSLAQNITINFTVKDVPANSGWRAVISMPNGDRLEKALDTMPEYTDQDGNVGKLVQAEVPIKYYDSNVTVDIKDASGKSVLGEPMVDSVKAYCDQYLASSASAADYAKYAYLIQRLEEYGEAAKAYFSGTAVDEPSVGDYSNVVDAGFEGKLAAGLTHEYATLVLESETKIRHYFVLDEGADISKYTFFIDFNENGILDPDEERAPLLADEAAAEYAIEIDGITPNDLDRAYKLVVRSGSDTYSCTYGAMTYAKRVNAQGGALKNLVAKMQSYWSAANELKATVTLNYDNGSKFKSFDYNYGVNTPIVIDEAPESKKTPGYGFIGWYEGDTKVDTIDQTRTGNITLIAKYKDNVIGYVPQDKLNGYNSSFTKEKVGTGVKFTTDNYVTFSGPSERLGVTSAYGEEFFDSAVQAGVRNLSFTVGLQMVSGYDNVAPMTMRIDSSSGRLNLFYLDTDNIVYFGGKANKGKAEYAMLDLDKMDANGNYIMQELKIDFDLSRIIKSGDTAVGIYTISALTNDGRRLTAEYEAVNMNYRFAQMCIAAADSPGVAGASYGIIVDSPKFTYAPNGISYVMPDTSEFKDGFNSTYTYGVSEALSQPSSSLHLTANNFDGYFFKSAGLFRGWYLDAECTQPIASVPANAAGHMLLYSKWSDETKEEYEAKKINGINDFKSTIASFNGTDMGEIPEFKSDNIATIFPNTAHPRLYVNENTLPTLKANLKDPESKVNYDTLINRALLVLNTDGRLPAASGDDPTNYNVEYSSGIEALAFLYLVTDNEYFGYAAISYALNFFDTVHFPKQEPGSDEEYKDSNMASGAVATMCMVYDWCYDLLTERTKEQLVQGICTKLAKYFEMGCPPELLGPITGHGTSTEVLRDFLGLAIATYEEYPEIYNYVLGKIEAEYVEAPEWYYPSGANFQGSAYGLNKSYCHMLSDILVYTMSGQHLYDGEELFRGVTETLIHQIRPDGEPIRMGDDYNQNGTLKDPTKLNTVTYSTGNMARLAFFGASYYKIPAAKAWFKEWTADYTTGLGWSSRNEMTPTVFLLLNDPEVSADDKYAGLELVHYNGSPTGAITVRSAWDDAKLDSTWMTFTTIDECYGANHDHKDAGTFQIYYKGMLALNSSAYQYDNGVNGTYGGVMDSAYVKQTISKNGLLIYNPDMKDNKNWWYSGGQTTQGSKNNENETLDGWFGQGTATQSKVLGYSYGYNGTEVKYAYISGDITNSYDTETVDLVMRSTMTLATGNADVPMIMLVYDRITSDNASYEKSFVLHTTNEPQFAQDVTKGEGTAIEGGKNWSGFTKVTGANSFYYTNTNGVNGTKETDDDRDKNDGRLTTQTLLPENPAYYYVGGDGKRFWINGKSAASDENILNYPVTEIGWGRVEIAPTEQNETDSFLNVMYVSDANTGVDTNAVLVSGRTHEGAVSYGNCVMFSKSNTAIYEQLSFTTEGSGNLTYYVGGLDFGEWKVSVGGEEQIIEVTEDGGLAVFEAACGEVTLTPNITKIAYEMDGGEFANGADIHCRVQFGETVQLPKAENVAKYLYRFDGWYTSADFSGSPVTEYNVTNEITVTIYAKWTKVQARIDYSTANGNITDKDYITEAEPGTAVALPQVEKEGFEFEGWYAEPTFKTKLAELNITDTDDVTVYALFVPTGARFEEKGKTVTSDTYYFLKGSNSQPSYGGNIGYEMLKLGYSKLTFRLDIADGSDWTNGAYIRMRKGDSSADELKILHFKDGAMKTGGNVVLLEEGSAGVVDLVIDFTSKTITYYLNGTEKASESFSTMGELKYYNYEVMEDGTPSQRGNMLQLTGAKGLEIVENGRYIFFGENIHGKAPTADIIYHGNGGTLAEGAPKKVEVGKTADLPGITREGHTFNGWYDNENFEGDALTEITCSANGANVNLYAKWTAKTVSITYEKNGGEINGQYSDKVTYGESVELPTSVSRKGYTFNGWYSDSSLGNKITSVSYADGGVTVYAGFTPNTVDITYETDGGIFAYDPPAKVAYGEPLTLPTNVSKSGYAFVGWYDNAEFNGDAVQTVSYPEGGEAIKVYAKWRVDLSDVTITYILNGGHFEGDHIDTVSPGGTVTLPTNVEYGTYIFDGWYTSADFSGEAITELSYDDAAFPLYAKWVSAPSIDVGGEDGGIDLPSIKI